MPKSTKTGTDGNRSKQHSFEWSIIVQLLTWISASAAAGFTLYLAVIAKDTEVRQLRAYVDISSSPPIHLTNDRIEFRFDNFGQTPASHIKIFTSWEFAPANENLPKDFKFPDKLECPEAHNVILGDSTLFPKNSLRWQRLHCPGDLEKIMQAQRSELSAFFYGHIDYVDVFRKSRRTNFCYFLTADGAYHCDRNNELDPN
jgi:hypothetical protein